MNSSAEVAASVHKDTSPSIESTGVVRSRCSWTAVRARLADATAAAKRCEQQWSAALTPSPRARSSQAIRRRRTPQTPCAAAAYQAREKDAAAAAEAHTAQKYDPPRHYNGRHLAPRVEGPQAAILAVKQLIEQQKNVQAAQQTLSKDPKDDKPLDDAATLQQCRLGDNGAMVHLTVGEAVPPAAAPKKIAA